MEKDSEAEAKLLDITPKGQAVKERTEKLDFIKNCSSKENVKRLRR